MRIKTILTVALAAWVLLAVASGVASAQVAAPKLNATASVTFNKFNPAVLPWNDSHRAGVGVLQLETKTDIAGVPQPDEKTTGYFLQGRYVDDAIGMHFEGRSSNSSGGAAAVKNTVGVFGLSVQARDFFSLGYSRIRSSNESGGVTNTTTQELNGITFRKDNLFFGFADGDSIATGGPASSSEWMWGLAFRNEKIHVEYFNLSNRIAGAADPDNTSGITLEGVTNELFLGYERVSTSFALLPNATDITQVITIGIKPDKGWTATASFLNHEIEDPGIPFTATTTGVILGIAQQF